MNMLALSAQLPVSRVHMRCCCETVSCAVGCSLLASAASAAAYSSLLQQTDNMGFCNRMLAWFVCFPTGRPCTLVRKELWKVQVLA